MNGLILPTIFTATGNYLSKVYNMSKETMLLGKNQKQLSSSFKSIAKGTAVVGTAMAVPLGIGVKSAIDFEDSMAGVAKVAGFRINDSTFNQLKSEAMDVAPSLGMTATEITNIYQALAQGGVKTDQLTKMAKVVGELATAFDLTSEEAGTMYMQTKNALGKSDSDVQRLMGVLNELDNAGTASAKNLLNFMAMGGSGVSRSLNIAPETIAAAGSALIGMGKDSSTAATNMEVFARTIKKGGSAANIFKKAGGGDAGFKAVFEYASKLGDVDQNKFFMQFGAYGSDLQLLAKNFNNAADGSLGFSSLMDIGKNKMIGWNSVVDEFNNKSGTTSFQLKKARAEFENASIELGNALLPAIADLAKELSPLIKDLAAFIKENPGIIKMAGAFMAMNYAVSGISGTVSALTTSFSLFGKSFSIIGMFSKGLAMLGSVLSTAIVGLFGFFLEVLTALGVDALGAIVGAVVAVGLVIWGVIESVLSNWEKVVTAFTDGGIMDGLMAIGKMLLDVILLPLQHILEAVDWITGTNMGASMKSWRDESMWGKENKLVAANNEKSKTEAQAAENQKAQTEVSGTVNVNINDPNKITNTSAVGQLVNIMPNALAGSNRK